MKGNENCFELARGSSYRGFELPGVDCTINFDKVGRGDHKHKTLGRPFKHK